VSRLENVSRRGFSVSVLAVSRHLYVLSCLMSHDCVLTVSLSGIAKCFFCAETLTFLAERRPLGPFNRRHCKSVVLVVVVLWL